MEEKALLEEYTEDIYLKFVIQHEKFNYPTNELNYKLNKLKLM